MVSTLIKISYLCFFFAAPLAKDACIFFIPNLEYLSKYRTKSDPKPHEYPNPKLQNF
jgi:hypothetical protein